MNALAEHQQTIPYLREGIIFLISSLAITLPLRKLRLSPVMGYMIAGALIGPSGFALISDPDRITAFAHLGVIFLLFFIGLELSFVKLRQMSRLIFGLGSLQILLSGSAIGTVAYLWGNSAEVSILLGVSLALSSTSIVMQVLTDREELTSRVGIASFSVLLLQDLAVVPLLAVITALGKADPSNSLSTLMLASFFKAAGAIIVILLVGRYLLVYPFRWVSAIHNQELFIALCLLVVLGTGYVTQAAGLSMEMGAFLAGLILAGTEFNRQVEADISPFRGLLLGLFFITVGMSINFSAEQTYALWILLSVVGLIIIKAVILFFLCLSFRMPADVSLRTGLLLGESGEFVFVVVAAALQNGLMPPPVAHFMILVAGLSLLATPLLATLGDFVVRYLLCLVIEPEKQKIKASEGLSNHVVIFGFGRMGQTVARLLSSERIPYVGVDCESSVVRSAKKNFNVFYGDATHKSMIGHTRIDTARLAVVAIGKPAPTYRTVCALRKYWPDLPIIARAHSANEMEKLKEAGVNIVIEETLESSLSLAQHVIRAFGFSSQKIKAFQKQSL